MSTQAPRGPDELPYRGMMPALGNPGEAPILWASLDGVRQNTFEYHEQASARHPPPTADDSTPDVRDDRVVSEGLTCDCGRPAGADGLCFGCKREHAGHAIGNHGGRL